jgi:hypothetical protein
LTIGFVRPSVRSTASSESNARPVAFAPTRTRSSTAPTTWATRANTNGFATLMIVNSTSASPTAKTSPLVPVTQTPNSSGETRASAG